MLLKYFQFLENASSEMIVYHGSTEEHTFNNRGGLFDGTFFSVSESEAGSYGKYVYKVILKGGLNLFDVNILSDCESLIDAVGILTDTYYSEDEDGYHVNAQQLRDNSDSRSAIENTDGAISWL